MMSSTLSAGKLQYPPTFSCRAMLPSLDTSSKPLARPKFTCSYVGNVRTDSAVPAELPPLIPLEIQSAHRDRILTRAINSVTEHHTKNSEAVQTCRRGSPGELKSRTSSLDFSRPLLAGGQLLLRGRRLMLPWSATAQANLQAIQVGRGPEALIVTSKHTQICSPEG